ncbi:putative membrane protein [Nocardia tenerifensis]|uniref:Putative membrane protein n=1 Tax=Nocardia tenerifensis TaxID=228006 RepID=A0A318KBC9_9NOCA|nr:membrane protein [Nocardia tenerifensis]PXX69062.1 putative membrane protein [Nocardia tenerifensis]
MADNALAPTRAPGRRPALALAALLFPMGVLHFVMPKPFDSIVPKALPGEPRNYTYASGVAEIGVAAALAMPRTRGLGGRLAALLFLAVLPANVQMAADALGDKKASRVFKIGTVLRLPLQIPLITQALKVSRSARNS